MSSGWLHRVIGKIAGSDFGRKLIGKTAHHAKVVIGKLERGWAHAQTHAPAVTNAIEHAADVLGVTKDAKNSYRAAKGLLDVGEAHGMGLDADHSYLLAKGKIKGRNLPAAPRARPGAY